MRARNLAFAAVLMASSAAADEQISGIGQIAYSVRQSVGTTSECIATTTGGSTCLLLPARASSGTEGETLAIVSASGASTCVWTLDATGALTSGALTSSTSATGFPLHAAGAAYHGRPRRDLIMQSDPDAPTGLCSVATRSGGRFLYAPCDTDGDCAGYGGGTCTADADLSTRQRWLAGAFIECASASGTISVDTVIEQVYEQGGSK